MPLRKSSFIKNYKQKVISPNLENMHNAVHHAFKLTDRYGVAKIGLAIAEASIKYNINEDVLRTTINDEDFIIENISLLKGNTNE